MSIHVSVDPANPGQFFACCGLLELAGRLWGGAEGAFADRSFSLRPASPAERAPTLSDAICAIARTPLRQTDMEDDFSSPLELLGPLEFRLDWWKDNHAGGDRLKVWAGSMRNARIARAMQAVLARPSIQHERLFDYGTIVYEASEPEKKVEPFYFDARRGSNARPIDIGFSTDSVQMTTVAYPAVEFLCLVGLQRFRPKPSSSKRVFEYSTWEQPLPTEIAPLAALGLLGPARGRRFHFENAFRTDQRKHKGFTAAAEL